MKQLTNFRLDFKTVEALDAEGLVNLINAVKQFAETGDADSVAGYISDPAVAKEFKTYRTRIYRRRRAVPRQPKPRPAAPVIKQPETVEIKEIANSNGETLPLSVRCCREFSTEGVANIRRILSQHCAICAYHCSLMRFVEAVERFITPLMPRMKEVELLGAQNGDPVAMWDVARRLESNHRTIAELDEAIYWYRRSIDEGNVGCEADIDRVLILKKEFDPEIIARMSRFRLAPE